MYIVVDLFVRKYSLVGVHKLRLVKYALQQSFTLKAYNFVNWMRE